MASTTHESITPNHHACQPGFSGFTGLLAGLSMAVGRGEHARLAADLAAVSPSDHVVDVGCGPGVAAREAARRGARVTGVEPAPVMLRLARALTRRDASITWAEGSAEELPLPDGSASVVWSLSTVHHWLDVDRGLAEARRALRARGRLIAMERRVRPGAVGHASHGWTDAQAQSFAECCAAAGFVDVRVETRAARRPLVVVHATKH